VLGDVSINNEAFLITDFVNLKIKLTQTFEGGHKYRVCVHIFIGVSAHTCMSICDCTVFLPGAKEDFALRKMTLRAL
jgi:hypothetical protein